MLIRFLYFTQGIRLIEHSMEYYKRECFARCFVNALCGVAFLVAGFLSKL